MERLSALRGVKRQGGALRCGCGFGDDDGTAVDAGVVVGAGATAMVAWCGCCGTKCGAGGRSPVDWLLVQAVSASATAKTKTAPFMNR